MKSYSMKDLIKGLKINNLTFIERAERPLHHKPNRKSYGLFKCECGEVMRRKITGGAGVHYNAYGFTKKNDGIEPMKQTTKYHGVVNDPNKGQ